MRVQFDRAPRRRHRFVADIPTIPEVGRMCIYEARRAKFVETCERCKLWLSRNKSRK